MARSRGLQRLLERAKAHPAVMLFAAAVGIGTGALVYVQLFQAVDEVRTPAPVADVIQIEAVPNDSAAFTPKKARWVATLENPTDRPLNITRAHFEVRTLYDGGATGSNTGLGATYATAEHVPISRNLYRLPLNCRSDPGSEAIVPPFPVPPKGSASLVIESDQETQLCYFRISFETTQGMTRAMNAMPVTERQLERAGAK